MNVLLASVTAILVGTGAEAATLTTSYADWLARAGAPVAHTTQLGAQFEIPERIDLNGGGSFTAENVYGTPNGIRDLSGSDPGWATWSDGYTGQVLYNEASAVTLTLSGLGAFGFEVEPDHDGPFDITVELSSGESSTLSVGGDAGARFFGFYGGGVTSLSITSQDVAFAYGNFTSVSAVPLPSSGALFGVALLGLGICARRMRPRPALSTRAG